MNVLVDTSAWSLALRRKAKDLNATERHLVAELRELIKEGRVQLFGFIRQELLSGIKTDEQYEKLRTVLREFPDQPVETSDHESAAKSSNECRSRGIVVSVVDILICALAIRHNLSILTSDPDFNHYAKVLPIKLHKP
ncbi:MAG TPA: PIN domain-containing protein, partial [Terriglobales bacterium]|nr:PIN domain-containing protein [Terriglobales bacterium]